jgi:hypothetical protein
MATIKLRFEVAELANVMSLYDQMQVQRSEIGPPSYTDQAFITNTTPTYPILTGTEELFPALQNKTLKFTVNGGAEQTVTFTLPDPVDLSNVIAQINDQATGVTADDNGEGKLELTGNTAGTGGTLAITGGTSITILGFTSGQKDNGKDANIVLQVNQTVYQYDDQSGLSTNWYRSRYYNSISGVYSSWSDWIEGTTGSAISAGNLIQGQIKLAQLDGTALSGREIVIINIYNPLKVEGYGVFGDNLSKITDALGQASFMLVKGTVVDLIIKGTSIARRITVPASGTEFDLLDDSLVQDDAFGIQVPDLPSAPRYS